MKQRAGMTWAKRLAWLWLGILVIVAALVPCLPLPYAPAVPDLAHVAAPPGSASHWLGTDAQGQDVLANLLFGTRTVVLLTLPAAALAALLGGLAGGIAGFWGNRLALPLPYWLAALTLTWASLRLPGYSYALALAMLAALSILLQQRMRWRWPVFRLPLDTFLLGSITMLGAVPRLLLVVAITSQGVTGIDLVVLLALLAWPEMARLVRAHMQRTRVLPFIEAARVAGLPPLRLWLWHALPHALQPLRTALPLSLTALIGLETTLSFLGVGLPPTVPSWGRMLASARLNPSSYSSAIYPLFLLIISIVALQTLATSPSFTIHKQKI
ncbi:ABC transporter permease subunit [Hymenobacter sp. ASUV-10]|uniref:ABC transporter permease subunit n=1 Tax=Hymenobacter aranciens TaxID=3063996 RepID=A0ABT9B8S6_9BACT|nr:ABC transporter permease subunit [Hymenobacter sp. ASUV-10]MDO7874608.1 ABC transporter permease subunit [Hymenobacter sp. ASUV-10]